MVESATRSACPVIDTAVSLTPGKGPKSRTAVPVAPIHYSSRAQDMVKVYVAPVADALNTVEP